MYQASNILAMNAYISYVTSPSTFQPIANQPSQHCVKTNLTFSNAKSANRRRIGDIQKPVVKILTKVKLEIEKSMRDPMI